MYYNTRALVVPSDSTSSGVLFYLVFLGYSDATVANNSLSFLLSVLSTLSALFSLSLSTL